MLCVWGGELLEVLSQRVGSGGDMEEEEDQAKGRTTGGFLTTRR
jgi:hypothetical protein